MFGFSLGKILVLALIVAAVWFGFKWIGRMNSLSQARKSDKVGKQGTRPLEDAEQMINCPVCEAYVVATSAQSCGREDCPYGG